MMQLVEEYLVIIEKEAPGSLYHMCSSVEEFNRLLQSDPEIHIDLSRIIHKGNFACEYDAKVGQVEGKPQRYFHMRFTFSGAEDQILEFAGLLRAVKKVIYNAGIKPETLWDDLSFYYSKKAYPLIHQIENLMRKLITYFMLTNVGKQWVAENLPGTLQKVIGDGQRGQYLDVLHQVDFIDLGEFLFKAYPTQRTVEHLYSEIEAADNAGDLDLEHLKDFVPRSNWDRYLSEIVECDDRYLKDRWEELYDLRCKVAHNAIVTRGDFERIMVLVEQVRSKLQAAIESLDQVHVPEDVKDQLAESAVSNISVLTGEFVWRWGLSRDLLLSAATSLKLIESDVDWLISMNQIADAFRVAQLITEELYLEWSGIIQFRNELVHGIGVVNEVDIRDYLTKMKSLTDQVLLLTKTINRTWKEEIVGALEALGGQASLSDIYEHIENNSYRELAKTWKATVRYTLQFNAVNTSNGRADGVFVHIDRGMWGLTSHDEK